MKHMVDAGLVLEGGGMRGIYTAGVLDFLLEKDLFFAQTYGVSAGACHACSYLSKQRGRAFRIGTNYLHDKRYCSLYSLLTTGDLFGAKMCYDTIPNELDLYDYDTFDTYAGEFFAVVTNCRTGQAEYLPVKELHRDVVAVRASSSLPLLSRMVPIGGELYLDGGASDSIPLGQSLRAGNRKNLVILTQCPTYRKEPNRMLPLIRLRYRKYPRLAEAMATRHLRYNEALDLVHAEQQAGRAFVIQPKTTPAIGRTEKDLQKLRSLYEEGYRDARESWDALEKFLWE